MAGTAQLGAPPTRGQPVCGASPFPQPAVRGRSLVTVFSEPAVEPGHTSVPDSALFDTQLEEPSER